ncbi:DNA-binding protein [Aneurinibacillus migulanus]|uniref:helix-turn-helix transcriptional regulator n=1 Tax=Aneurinibacillus migulanus TaxID=47500 RepID=UPI0005BC2A51|nr:AraC family transcriptional regulator [Aneurinibacillus migulanus]KIV55911.1 DNA-binding protein [Aneurinibacillus migulanus]KPD05369.1 DNA-binding protein [Aneurinibacillus migulanus]
METIKEIVAERRTYTATQDTHSHRYAQLILPLEGELFIETGTQHLRLDHHTLFFVPPECDHTFHSVVRNEFLVLDIPHFMLAKSKLQNRGISYKLNNQWKGIRYLILNEIDKQSLHGPALKELYPYISYHLLQEQQPKSIRYIHEHYNENITVDKLASLEHYHRSYYSEWFLEETGKSPSAYIREVRLNKAKELLRDTDLPILHIAIQVGLEHQSSLTRLFQKYEEITPSQFRTKYK